MPAPGRPHRSSGGASATPVGGPPLATSSGTVVAAEGGLETVHRFMLCGKLVILDLEFIPNCVCVSTARIISKSFLIFIQT